MGYVIDRNGNVTSYAYGYGVITITDQYNLPTTLTYDGSDKY